MEIPVLFDGVNLSPWTGILEQMETIGTGGRVLSLGYQKMMFFLFCIIIVILLCIISFSD